MPQTKATEPPVTEVLERLAQEATETLRDSSRRESLWSAGRLVAFLMIFAPWVIVPSRPLAAGIASMVLLAIFIAVVRRHMKVAAERDAASRLSTILAEALSRTGGQLVCVRGHARPADSPHDHAVLPQPFPPSDAWRLSEQEREDLDFYTGPVGVFGLLNRTSSAIGARRLRDVLETPLLHVEAILARQERVRLLAKHHDSRANLMAGFAAARREDERVGRFIRAVADSPELKLPLSRPLLWTLTIVNPAIVATGLTLGATAESLWYVLTLLYLIVPWMILGRCRESTERLLAGWRDVAWGLRAIRIGARTAVDHLPPDPRFDALRRPLLAATAHDALPRLARRIAWTDHAGPMQGLMDLLFFLRLHVARGVDGCLRPARTEILSAAGAVAELEMITSLASFSAEQPLRAFPEFHTTPGIEIDDGAHPLVAPTSVIPNSIRLDRDTRVWVITGSNMAGKSTLLRMTGICTVLAQIGCAVPAAAMRLQPLRLITDLRVRDNLSQAESYFLAEVRHLRRLLLPDESGPPVLGLIDEPFRGTNSEDQSAASVAVLEHLIGAGHFFLVATHDRHLTELAQSGPARNFHFRENLADGAMVFDYRLHDGPAQTRNALRILEIEGYPQRVVQRAHDWLHANSRAASDDVLDGASSS